VIVFCEDCNECLGRVNCREFLVIGVCAWRYCAEVIERYVRIILWYVSGRLDLERLKPS
jgi:hypothetical protein